MRRFILYFMTLVLFSGSIVAFLYSRQEAEKHQARVDSVRDAIERLERQIRVQAATGEIELNGRGWPKTIDPDWFKEDTPINVMVPTNRPWLEIASSLDESLDHPTIRQTVTENLASFWYNPATGRVRARIGPQVSDRKALDLYNSMNGSAVATLFDSEVETVAEGGVASNPRYEELLNPDEQAEPMIVVRRREPKNLQRSTPEVVTPANAQQDENAEGEKLSEASNDDDAGN